MARLVLLHPEEYEVPVYPNPPVGMASDAELMETAEERRRGHKLKAGEARELHTFGRWRAAVWRQEVLAERRVRDLLWAARTFAEAAEPAGEQVPTAEQVEHAAAAEVLCAKLREEWGVQVPPLPEPAQDEKVAHLAAVRLDLLPPHMRELDRRLLQPGAATGGG